MLAVGLILTTLTSCGSSQELRASAARIGGVNAGLALPKYPTECRRDTPHATLTEGADSVSTLKRERGQLDKANAKRRACEGFWDKTVEEYEKAPRKASEEPLPESLRR